jgi:hypothetical protein
MKHLKSQFVLPIGFIGAISLWLVYGFLRLDHPVEKWGVFGDKFGALNCLFTGLAFAALLATFLQAREEASGRDTEQRELFKLMRAQNLTICHSARVMALSAALNHTREERGRIHSVGTVGGPAEQRKNELDVKIARLARQLDEATETRELL